MIHKILFSIILFCSLKASSQSISEIRLDNFKYHSLDSAQGEFSGVLKTGNTVIITLFKNLTFNQIKVLVNNGPDIIEEEKEKIGSFIQSIALIFFNDKIHKDFLSDYSTIAEYDYDNGEILIGPTSANYLMKYKEISMGTSIFIAYKLEEGR